MGYNILRGSTVVKPITWLTWQWLRPLSPTPNILWWGIWIEAVNKSCRGLPSGKLTVCYGKSPFFIGKSTINGPCSIAMFIKVWFPVWSSVAGGSPRTTEQGAIVQRWVCGGAMFDDVRCHLGVSPLWWMNIGIDSFCMFNGVFPWLKWWFTIVRMGIYHSFSIKKCDTLW